MTVTPTSEGHKLPEPKFVAKENKHSAFVPQIIRNLDRELNYAVKTTLEAKLLSENDRVAAAAKLVEKAVGASLKVRQEVLQKIEAHVRGTSGDKELLQKLSAQLEFDDLVTSLTDSAYEMQKDLSDDVFAMQSGNKDIQLDSLIKMANTLNVLRDHISSTPGVDKEEALRHLHDLSTEYSDLANDIFVAIKHAKSEYEKALKAWEKSRPDDNAFALYNRLQEARSYLSYVGDLYSKSQHLEDAIGGPIKELLRSIVKMQKQDKDRNFPLEFVVRMDQVPPSEIRDYAEQCINEFLLTEHPGNNALALFKRQMSPFFLGEPPLLPAQKAAFLEAKQKATAILAKYENVPVTNYNFRAKLISEMQESYRKEHVDQKTLEKITEQESTDSTTSKISLFFLAMQSMIMLRGAVSLLSSKDAKEMQQNAAQMQQDVFDALDKLDPNIRNNIERDASKMVKFLSETGKWEAMRAMPPEKRDAFLNRLSPEAKAAVNYLVDRPIPRDPEDRANAIEKASQAVIGARLGQYISPLQHMGIKEWFSSFLR